MGAGDSLAGAAPAGHDPVPEPSAPAVPRGPGAIWYDGAARDWLLDGRGNYTTLHYVDQKVALALLVNQGDIAALPDFGSRLKKLSRSSPARLPALAEDAVRQSLAEMLTAGEIELVRIDVQTPARGKLLVTTYYRNFLLSNSQQRSVTSTA